MTAYSRCMHWQDVFEEFDGFIVVGVEFLLATRSVIRGGFLGGCICIAFILPVAAFDFLKFGWSLRFVDCFKVCEQWVFVCCGLFYAVPRLGDRLGR